MGSCSGKVNEGCALNLGAAEKLRVGERGAVVARTGKVHRCWVLDHVKERQRDDVDGAV